MNIYIDPGTTESGVVFTEDDGFILNFYKDDNPHILEMFAIPGQFIKKVVIELPVIYQKADSHLIDTILFVGQAIEASKPAQVYFVTRSKVLWHLFKYSGSTGSKRTFGDKETAVIIKEYFKLTKPTNVDVRAALSLLMYDQTGGELLTLAQIRGTQKIEKDKKRARTKARCAKELRDGVYDIKFPVPNEDIEDEG